MFLTISGISLVISAMALSVTLLTQARRSRRSKAITMSLAKSPAGEVELVKGCVPTSSNDGDFSVEMADAGRRLTSLGYNVYGAFFESCPEAKLVNLAGC